MVVTLASFARHSCEGRRSFQQPNGWSSSFVSLRLSPYRDLARLPRASGLLPEAGSLFFACPKKSNQKK
ncbi:hypothetical protein, partial [Dyella japonica]|uniref:hypothetical protein n=1 Tax=Dyella japonica TaxID=231455 RepID=UPI001B8035CD